MFSRRGNFSIDAIIKVNCYVITGGFKCRPTCIFYFVVIDRIEQILCWYLVGRFQYHKASSQNEYCDNQEEPKPQLVIVQNVMNDLEHALSS